MEQSSKGQKKEKMSLYQNDRKGESMEEKRESFRIKVRCPICETSCWFCFALMCIYYNIYYERTIYSLPLFISFSPVTADKAME